MINSSSEKEILVVVSKLKQYIRSVSGMNTAGSVAPALSDTLRHLCDQAIEKAKSDGDQSITPEEFKDLMTMKKDKLKKKYYDRDLES